MNADLRDLYQEIILDHNRSPRNRGDLPGATCEAHGNNPLCGDRVTVRVRVEDDRVEEVRFDARGCAIAVASASMMTDALAGRSLEEALDAAGQFVAGLTAPEPDGAGPDGTEDLGELAALSGVRRFPTRIKCATLPWHAFRAALRGDRKEVTTEGDE